MSDDYNGIIGLIIMWSCFALSLLLTWACNRLDAGSKPSVPLSIPVVDFNTKDYRDDIECVVCLSELADGDKAKVFPSCNHWFHAECIDMWLQSHSTCPICRKIIGSVQNHEPLTVTQDANLDHATSSTDEHRGDVRVVVVDIPACL